MVQAPDAKPGFFSIIVATYNGRVHQVLGCWGEGMRGAAVHLLHAPSPAPIKTSPWSPPRWRAADTVMSVYNMYWFYV